MFDFSSSLSFEPTVDIVYLFSSFAYWLNGFKIVDIFLKAIEPYRLGATLRRFECVLPLLKPLAMDMRSKRIDCWRMDCLIAGW